MAKRRPPLDPDAVLPATPDVDRDLKAFERGWWERQTLAETGMSLSSVVIEFQFQVCAYITGRLRDPQTPDAVKDAFALRGMPNLGVIFKNADATGASLGLLAGPAAQPEAPRVEGTVPNVASVLEAYRTSGKVPH